MKNRSTAFFTLMSFSVFFFSCASIKRVNPGSLSENSKVKRIEKKSGQIIEFSKTGLGQVYGDKIVGTEAVQKAPGYVSIAISEVEKAWVKQKNPLLTVLSACLTGICVYVFISQVLLSATHIVGGR